MTEQRSSETKFRDERAELLAKAEELFEAASSVLRVIDRQGGITKNAKAVQRLREVLGHD